MTAGRPARRVDRVWLVLALAAASAPAWLALQRAADAAPADLLATLCRAPAESLATVPSPPLPRPSPGGTLP